MTDFLNFDRGGAKQTTESVGGGRTLFNSGVYSAKVKQAYLDNYDGGSRFASVTLEIDGKDYEERLLLANDKGQSFWNDRDGNPVQYSGLSRLEELAFAAGFPNLQATGVGTGNIRVWDKDAKAFVLKQHATVMLGLAGKQVLVALQKISQNKQKKNPQTNKYEKLNEREEVNSIEKFANLQKQTQLEAANNVNPPAFIDAWSEKWTGKVNDKYKQQANTATQGLPSASGGAAADDNLFG